MIQWQEGASGVARDMAKVPAWKDHPRVREAASSRVRRLCLLAPDGSGYRERVPLSPVSGEPDPDGADCVACGRCCHHGPQTVHLLEADEARMGDRLLPIYTEVQHRPPYFRFIKNGGERCGGLDASVPGQYPCAIYEVRPEDCGIVEIRLLNDGDDSAPQGEDPKDAWVFAFFVGDFTDHGYSAVIDKKGQQAPYVYAFN